MKERYVVDTNVLIAASAANPTDPKDIDATPADPAQRMRVWQWLSEFQFSSSKMVLDTANGIYSEYTNKLGFNDYGIQVVMHKWSTAAVDNVEVAYDSEGHGILQSPLLEVIHDLADKKMVAAALDCLAKYGEGCVAFAGDTDWHDWEADLLANNILLEPIIEDWSRQKHAEKQAR
jgi:hypothetical protein